ncbi:MAG: alpha/beta hydrolase [Pseudomonadota bacterium]
MRRILIWVAVVVALLAGGVAWVFVSRDGAFIVANLPRFVFPGDISRGLVFDTETSLALDIYTPKDAEGAPVIVFFYGGSWQTGERGNYAFVAMTLAREGFVVALPDYRKFPDVRFPAFVEDGARAIAWLRENVATFGGDPERMYLSGHSAGAHIAMLLAMDESYLAAEGAAGAVKGVSGLAGPYHFTPTAEDTMAIFGPPERYPLMQAGNYVNGGEPPVQMQYGLSDETVGYANIERLGAPLEASGVCHAEVLYDDLSHVQIVADFAWPYRGGSSVPDDMVAFFRAIEAGGACPGG